MPSRANSDVSQWMAERVVRGLTAVLSRPAYALPMTVLVLRKSVDDERVGGPYICADPTEIARIIGRLTLEERVAHLLAANEIIRVTEEGQVKVFRGDELVGYIVVLTADSEEASP
jgi:hypothetical protein